jgi:hypothetical protein
MKRFILCLLLAVSCSFLIALVSYADKVETIEFLWDWSGPVPPEASDLEWRFFMRGEGESYDYANPVFVVPYNSDTPSSFSGDILIEGDMGQTVRKYFVLRAFYEGEESPDSNEPYKDFVIPYSPYNMRINVVIRSTQQ